jgi:hypothetical protein
MEWMAQAQCVFWCGQAGFWIFEPVLKAFWGSIDFRSGGKTTFLSSLKDMHEFDGPLKTTSIVHELS